MHVHSLPYIYFLDSNFKLRGLGVLQSLASSSADKVTDDTAGDWLADATLQLLYVMCLLEKIDFVFDQFCLDLVLHLGEYLTEHYRFMSLLQCSIEWFHFACVGLTTKPRGKW